MSVRKAKRSWPDQAENIKPDSELIKELGDERREIAGAKGVGDTSASKILSAVANFFGGGKDKENDDQTLVVEVYVKDYTEVAVGEPVEDPETGEMVQEYEPKYTGNMRRIIACSGGKVILEDRDNPNINPNLEPEQARMTYLFDKFPFTRVQSIKDSVSGWGQSDWEQLEGLQKEFAKTLSQYGFFKDRAVRPKIVNPKDSGIANEEFTNALGILNPSSADVAAGIRYLEMNNNALMRELQGSLNLIRELFFLVAGTFELEQAQTGQVTAYKAIAALLEHAATMMRGKIRAYQKLIRERGRMYVSHVQNFYTEQRYISYEENGQDDAMPIKGSELIVPGKLTVVAGSTLPRAKVQEREEAMELFKSGAIDTPELLRKLEWPNRAEVIQRMQAGPLGEFIERLAALGMPEQILAVLQQIAQMDQKEFEKAFKAGELPTLQLPQQAGPTDAEQMTKYRENVEIGKLIAEKDLIVEKVVSERVSQQVKMAGIEFDAQQLEIMRQKAKQEYEGHLASMVSNRPGYNEQGMQSNNQQ